MKRYYFMLLFLFCETISAQVQAEEKKNSPKVDAVTNSVNQLGKGAKALGQSVNRLDQSIRELGKNVREELKKNAQQKQRFNQVLLNAQISQAFGFLNTILDLVPAENRSNIENLVEQVHNLPRAKNPEQLNQKFESINQAFFQIQNEKGIDAQLKFKILDMINELIRAQEDQLARREEFFRFFLKRPFVQARNILFGPFLKLAFGDNLFGAKGEGGAALPEGTDFKERLSSAKNERSQWSWKRMGLDETTIQRLVPDPKALPRGREPMVVAVIDSGADLLHPELRGQLWVNKKEIPFNRIDDDGNGYVDDYLGFNFAEWSPDIEDRHGHGTYVAGVIAAKWNGSGIAGVNPHCRIMVLKATEDHTGLFPRTAVANAILYAVKKGAKIIHVTANFSPPGLLEKRAVRWAIDQGALIITPANSKSINTAKVSPACLPGVLTVGASDRQDRRVACSGWGNHLDLVAPGIDITSLRAASTDFLALMAGKDPKKSPSGAILNEKWYLCDGTCAAAPLVTGAASLIWQHHPKWTAEEVKRVLLMSSDDIDQPGWDIKTGAGRLNIKKALQASPNHFLATQISQVNVVRRNGQTHLEIQGRASGTHFRRRKLQIAFGENPPESDWATVAYSQAPVSKGQLGQIPVKWLTKKGRWSIRSRVEDSRGTVRQATVTVRAQYRPGS